MITRRFMMGALVLSLAGMTIGLPAAIAKSGDAKLTARLAGAAINRMVPKGVAESRSRADGSSQLKVQVENANLAGATLNVLIDNSKVGELTIDAFLAGEMQLNTNDGQTVPPIGRGSTCVVTDQSGATIVAGTF
ncbi:MAG TPA: hypothetical protein VLM38_24565 [Blastocatellia bacterium]|nr:hypothetical protein [Blastocatellia bacterium]